MFRPVSSKMNFPQLEEGILRLWKERDIFRKSIEQRPEDRLFIFYEGPPYANASPGVHHVLSRIYKDVMVRYKTMRGYRVPRKAGWDTHGLPAELEVERSLGFKSKADIEAFGIEEFNRRCRENVFAYLKEWEALTERIAFWLDLDQAYITCSNDYMESCWWVVKQLWDRGLVYQDYRVTPHCPRCGTSLSDHEVAQGYQENTPDPALYVKFRLTAESEGKLRQKVPGAVPTYFLAWTTTPWTLPGNTALAVDAEADYAVAEVTGRDGPERLILAAGLVSLSLGDGYKVVARLGGREFAGLHYEPLYDAREWGVEALGFNQEGRLVPLGQEETVEKAYSVITADFVSLTEGTGIVHMAPAFGGEDFEAGKAEGLLFLQPVDLRGQMTAPGTSFDGLFVKDADEPVLDDLEGRGLLLRRETIYHTYPFCWRCDTPLLYYAKPTWYIRTTAVKERLVALNRQINWYPAHIREGRFGNWLENNIDWAVSRERFWGIPLPIWRCQACGQHDCIGSLAELRERAEDKAKAEALDDLHRPYVDEITLACRQCGGSMRRVVEVLDVWFDSGAMPYAQWHYPFEKGDTFAKSFPADFISEAVDQTRGWFYTLHALSTLLFDSVCFRNVICLELILDAKGEKMSKSKGNVVEPWAVLNAHGADALRWYLFTATPPGTARRFSTELVGEALRRFLFTLWNTYSFFVTYALIDRFDPRGQAQGERSEMDRWVLSELNVLVDKATRYMDGYNPTDAGRAIQAFVDDLSNWYVRRSRRRFWKSEDDADKLAAHQTLYACLVTVAKLLAPFAPFVAEEMYQNLVCGWFPEEPESVHLAEWPAMDPSLVDEQLMADTRLVMRIASLGRNARSKAGIKVRQPLQRVLVKPRYPAESEALQRLAPQILDELNVKELAVVGEEAALEREGLVFASEGDYAVGLVTTITPELADEGLARELVHRLQTMRKNAGFDIADYIVTYYQGSPELCRIMEQHGAYVRQETLSRELIAGPPPAGAHIEEHKVSGQMITLAVERRP
ncbi:MAG: isoleucine--tRNA ligase [Dehalococcoidia bacterium]